MSASPSVVFIVCLFFMAHTVGADVPPTTQKKRPLKILFIIPEFPKFNQTFILNQITGLIDRGHDVYILARETPERLMPPEVAQYNLLEKTFYRILPAEQYNYDIIFAQFGREGRVGLNLRKKGVTGKLVTCFRGDEVAKPLHTNSTYYDELFATGDLFLPVCDYFKQALLAAGCPQEKTVILHSGINLAKFPFKLKKPPSSTDPIKLITVCRLTEKKGIYYSIKAVEKLVKEFPNITFTIIGDGKERKNLYMLIKKLDLKKQVKILTWLPHEKVADKLHQSHIFIHPSLVATNGGLEGIPNTLKEAMACGLPVISTYHSGIPELIHHNVSGFLVQEKSVMSLVKRVKKLINQPELWQSMALAARKHVEQTFDMHTLNDQLELLLYKVINE